MSSRVASPYEQQLADFRLAYSKAGCVTSMILVILGVGLDHFSYPARANEFLLVRTLVVLMSAGIWTLLFTATGRRYVRWLTMGWLLLPQIMIAWMIQTTEGVDSIYFVGLHLAMYAVGIILPITLFEGVGFGLATLVLYFLACVLHPLGVGDGARLYTNGLFILFSAIASAVCTWFNERARNRLFSLQHSVALNNQKLLEINQALAALKGQLIQREKMAAIGTLSAGLLHELNNPVNYSLMAINMGLSLPSAKADEMLRESLVDAKEGMDRIQKIVSDLKTFAYQKPGDEDTVRPFLLERALRSAQRLAGHELKGVEVVLTLVEDTHVMGDEPALIGVLINLLSNAAHGLQLAKREHPRIDVRLSVVGDRLHCAVRDNGQGIAPDNLNRVFEPFFTTRDVGAGLGLGLSVSYSIIQRHGSTLTVQSQSGEWTEFSFDLPRPT